MTAVARHVQVTGRVQGVFFRAWTRDLAAEHRVRGWVRNASDGSVEAHFEGDESAVDQVVARMRSGPPRAMVEGLRISEASVEHLSSFEVLY